MTHDCITREPFPLDGLMFQDFARVACPAEWEAWEQAEKKLADAGGRPLGGRLLPFTFERSSHSVTTTPPERRKVRARADQAERDLVIAVLDYLKTGSAWGPYHFRGMLNGGFEPVNIWPDLLANTLRVDLETSTIVIRGGSRFHNVHVFKEPPPAASTSAIIAPTVATGDHAGSIIIRGSVRAVPFTPEDVAAVGSLQRALDQLVFNHPRVEVLRQKAKAAMAAEKKPFYDNVGLLSPVYGHNEEMISLKSFVGCDQLMSRDDYELWAENSQFKNSVPRWPKEYDDFRDEVELRAVALIEMLQSGQLEGVCYTARTKERETLLPTIWTREEYYVLPRTGDIFEAKPMKMVPRWTDVVLRLPSAVSTAAPRSRTRAVDRVAGCTLAEAFHRFVLDDPGLGELLKHANSIPTPADEYFRPGERLSFQHGYCCGPLGEAIWPMDFEGHNICKVVHPDPEKRHAVGYLKEPDAPELIAAGDEFTRLYAAFMEMPRTGEVEAHGIPAVAGDPPVIPRSIWSHRDFYFSADTGDVFVNNPDAHDPPKDWLLKRWRAVELRHAQATNAQQPEQSAAMPTASSTDRIENVVPLVSSPRLNQRSTAAPGRKRGKRPVVLGQVMDAMRLDLSNGTFTSDGLEQMLEKSLAEKYEVSRDTCRKARAAVIAQLKGSKSRNGTRT
jgi:hypothetical protein